MCRTYFIGNANLLHISIYPSLELHERVDHGMQRTHLVDDTCSMRLFYCFESMKLIRLSQLKDSFQDGCHGRQACGSNANSWQLACSWVSQVSMIQTDLTCRFLLGVFRIPGHGVSSNSIGPFGYGIIQQDSQGCARRCVQNPAMHSRIRFILLWGVQ